MSGLLEVIDLGQRGYLDTLALQREYRLARLDGREPNDLLLLVEHEPTYTLGRSTRPDSLPVEIDRLRERGATVVEVERGGDVTWHGPGQLVGYPILDLRDHRQDLHWYLRSLEGSIVAALDDLGVVSQVEPGRTGVWTAGRKIASIGIHVKQWVTLHGFSLNVNPEMSWFDSIVPCGIHGVEMTSLALELRESMPTGAAVSGAMVKRFGDTFGLAPRPRAGPRAKSAGPG